jgi:surfeit locus 1 family protein
MTSMSKKAQRKGLLWPAVFTVCGFAILVWLGVWQLERLRWKEGLIADIDARSDAVPGPLPAEAQWPQLNPQDYDYRHVEAHGQFDYDKEVLVFRPSGPGEYGPGYLVLTPLLLDNGAIVIVNRGYVRQEHKDPAERGQIPGDVTVKGLMRPSEPRNLFTPADEPAKGIYFTRDPAELAAHFHLARVAPFTIDADAAQVPGGWPKGGTTVRALPNNHLEYAITWFGLAAGLVGVFLAVVLNRRRELGHGETDPK